jgi:hypothetical protein
MGKKANTTEKCYITRDESDDKVWVWRKPSKGKWSPSNIGEKGEFVNWQRIDTSLENTDYYYVSDFKKKFGINIKHKTKKCVHLPIELLNNDDYKLISNNKDRKK